MCLFCLIITTCFGVWCYKMTLKTLAKLQWHALKQTALPYHCPYCNSCIQLKFESSIIKSLCLSSQSHYPHLNCNKTSDRWPDAVVSVFNQAEDLQTERYVSGNTAQLLQAMSQYIALHENCQTCFRIVLKQETRHKQECYIFK